MASSPDHPIADSLREIGNLHLVGSRCFNSVLIRGDMQKVWSDESDWDYYLGVELKKSTHEPHTLGVLWAADKLISMGFERLKGEGGPYGYDQLIEGVFRLPEATVWGKKFPHVDVILGNKEEIQRRMVIWNRIRSLEGRGAVMCRGMKTEKSWGAFWWSTSEWR